MRLLITGVNHNSAPLEVRECLSFDQGSLAPAVSALKKRDGVIEGMILSTCNRVEVAVTAEDGADFDSLVPEFLCAMQRLDPSRIQPYLYRYEDEEAIRHLFRVAASLDSMVVGEPQILGQLKAAYAVAKAEGAIAGVLDIVVTRAFGVAKRVRSETAIGENAVSVSYVAVELARQIFGRLDNSSVMIIGAGKMSELAARHLRRAGATQIFVTNRTHDRAIQLAELFEGSVVPYDEFKGAVPRADIVITSSGAPHYLLTKTDVRAVVEARRNKPIFLIDIAVPRNIEPAVNELDNVFLYDIDDLQQVVSENLKSRQQEATEAESIVEEEVRRTVSRLKVQEVKPTIVGLQQQLDRIREAEMARVRGKLAAMTPEQRELVEGLTRSLMNKIAHGPITELRRSASQPDGVQSIEVIRRVFRLDD